MNGAQHFAEGEKYLDEARDHWGTDEPADGVAAAAAIAHAHFAAALVAAQIEAIRAFSAAAGGTAYPSTEWDAAVGGESV